MSSFCARPPAAFFRTSQRRSGPRAVVRTPIESEAEYELGAVMSVAEAVAREASDLIRERLGKSLDVSTKLNARDLLTEAS